MADAEDTTPESIRGAGQDPETPNFNELMDKLRRLLRTLEAREFGLITWRDAVYQQGVEVGKFFGMEQKSK